MLEDALGYLSTNGITLVPFNAQPVPLPNGMTAQIGLNNHNVIGQFFPLPGTSAVNFTKAEMEAFKMLFGR